MELKTALIALFLLSVLLGFSTYQNMYAFDGKSRQGTGGTAVEIDKAIAEKYAGPLTDDKVQRMMIEFKPEQDLHGLNAAYLYQNALQSALFRSFSDLDGNWNGLSVIDVYGTEEIQVGYTYGWLETSQNMVRIFIVLSLVIAIMTAPVFSGEYGGRRCYPFHQQIWKDEMCGGENHRKHFGGIAGNYRCFGDQSCVCLCAVWKQRAGLQHPLCPCGVCLGLHPFQHYLRHIAEISDSFGLYRRCQHYRHHIGPVRCMQKTNGGIRRFRGGLSLPRHAARQRDKPLVPDHCASAVVPCAIRFPYVGRANKRECTLRTNGCSSRAAVYGGRRFHFPQGLCRTSGLVNRPIRPVPHRRKTAGMHQTARKASVPVYFELLRYIFRAGYPASPFFRKRVRDMV